MRAAGHCEYCHAPQILIGQTFHLDHVIPRSVGGQTVAENLCFACSHCNIAKSNRTAGIDPRSRMRVRLYNPRMDRYLVESPLFTFTVPPNNVLGVPADTGQSVSNGYYLMLAPLSVGAHILHFGGTFTDPEFTLDITYNLTIAPRSHHDAGPHHHR
jgi:HNH endonuclease